MKVVTTTNSYIRVLTVLVAMVAAALLVAMMVAYGSASAQSTTNTIEVTTTDDESTPNDGKCSLREAIQNANANTQTSPDCQAGSATEDRIIFSLGNEATIGLGSQLLITDASGLTIDGQKAKITVSGKDAVRVFQVDPAAQLELARLTVAHGCNGDLGGGVFNNGGTLTVTNSTVSDNHCANPGGGIYNNSNSTLTVVNSTFFGNSANTGGGIYNNVNGTLTVTNSTFSNNRSNNPSGAIRNFVGTATLSNTIVANSPSGGNCSETVNAITDGGYNIDDDGTCVDSTVTTSRTTDPKLDPNGLQSNGGPTQTIKLLKGSPALNAIPKGTNGCGTEIKTDQRGVSRPQGSKCDIGAYELKLKSSGNHHHHHRHHHKHKDGGGGGGIGIGG